MTHVINSNTIFIWSHCNPTYVHSCQIILFMRFNHGWTAVAKSVWLTGINFLLLLHHLVAWELLWLWKSEKQFPLRFEMIVQVSCQCSTFLVLAEFLVHRCFGETNVFKISEIDKVILMTINCIPGLTSRFLICTVLKGHWRCLF